MGAYRYAPEPYQEGSWYVYTPLLGVALDLVRSDLDAGWSIDDVMRELASGMGLRTEQRTSSLTALWPAASNAQPRAP